MAEWWALLTDAPEPIDANFFALIEFDDHAAALWSEHGPRILSTWPSGTRPSCWWKFDAPRLQNIPAEYRDCYFTPDMIEPRRLLSGAGRPAHEVLAVVPRFELGIPVDWHGFEPGDPPAFETQHAYLERHGLLARGEGPAEVEPEVALQTYWSEK
jgi:hypothetical protein